MNEGRSMRRIILVAIFVMILSVVLITPAHRTEARASMSNANLFLVASTLSIDDVSMDEGQAGTTNMVFHVTLTSSGTHSPVTVHYRTTNASATAPSDYTSINDALGFPTGTGDAMMTISVPIIGDTIV